MKVLSLTLSKDIQLKKRNKIAIDFDAKVLIAYNRRFYSSVEKAREIITEDGGIQSCIFEFTEWAHKIIALSKANGVKEHWFLGNSSHVIDLVFHFIFFFVFLDLSICLFIYPILFVLSSLENDFVCGRSGVFSTNNFENPELTQSNCLCVAAGASFFLEQHWYNT